VISIATHEFGHAVALNHSSASADVMWQYINAGQVKRTLTAHDKDGISWFYPVH
jgi:predicted Zn-dependent protease